jgi:hypothetical protein
MRDLFHCIVEELASSPTLSFPRKREPLLGNGDPRFLGDDTVKTEAITTAKSAC